MKKAFFVMITLLSCVTIFCCISCVEDANPSEMSDGVDSNVDPYNSVAMDYWLKNAVDEEDTVVYEDINNVEVDLFFGIVSYTQSFANQSKEYYKPPYSLVIYDENQKQERKAKLEQERIENMHKRIKCEICDGAGCKWCHYTGYINQTSFGKSNLTCGSTGCECTIKRNELEAGGLIRCSCGHLTSWHHN